jgi:hypothetical protein
LENKSSGNSQTTEINTTVATTENCAKEWEIWVSNAWSYDKPCCNWLKWKSLPNWDWINSPRAMWAGFLCYNPTRWIPSCIVDWHRLEWRYYSNWDLLKQDVNCK